MQRAVAPVCLLLGLTTGVFANAAEDPDAPVVEDSEAPAEETEEEGEEEAEEAAPAESSSEDNRGGDKSSADKKKKDKEGDNPKKNTVVLDVAKLAWPAVGLEYERRLLRKVGVAAFGEMGRFNPIVLNASPENPLNDEELRFRGGGIRANFYAAGSFKNGLVLGLSAQKRTFVFETGIQGTNETATATVPSTVFGAHLGYKLILRPGFTAGFLGGVGYHQAGDIELEAAGQTASEPNPLAELPVMTYGSFRMGWSF